MPHRFLALDLVLPTQTLVSRVRQRLLHPWSPPPASSGSLEPSPSVPKRQAATPTGRKARLEASVSEFLLIMRLRARRPAEPTADVLERGVRIVSITCQNWFGSTANSNFDHQTRI